MNKVFSVSEILLSVDEIINGTEHSRHEKQKNNVRDKNSVTDKIELAKVSIINNNKKKFFEQESFKSQTEKIIFDAEESMRNSFFALKNEETLILKDEIE